MVGAGDDEAAIREQENAVAGAALGEQPEAGGDPDERGADREYGEEGGDGAEKDYAGDAREAETARVVVAMRSGA